MAPRSNLVHIGVRRVHLPPLHPRFSYMNLSTRPWDFARGKMPQRSRTLVHVQRTSCPVRSLKELVYFAVGLVYSLLHLAGEVS